MLSTWLLLQWAASAFAFCPQAWGQPRASSPSPLALPRVSAAPQANGIKITSFNSAEARAAARREAAQAAQPPLPPPDPEVHAVQAVPQQANPPSVPMPHAVQPPVPQQPLVPQQPQQPLVPQQPPEPPPVDPAAAAAQATAQAASQAAAAQAAADRLTVQLAVDAAAAAAAAVLRSGAGDVSGATVSSIIAGFPARLQQQLLGGPAAPSPAQPPAPTAAPAQPSAPAPAQAQAPGLAPAPAPTPVVPVALSPAQAFGLAPMPAPVPAVAAREPPPAALDKATLTRVLSEFVGSPYAKKLFDDAKVQPLIGSGTSMIGCMFKTLSLTGAGESAKLEVTLHQEFQQRSDRLLEHLVKHLRATMPQLKRLSYSSSSPPSTRTIIL